MNVTISSGGTDAESDESFRERIHEAPESFSNAGSYGAYAYFAKLANADIIDVSVTSPSPGEVKIVPLLSGGAIPGEEVLKDVLEVCSADKARPLTDHVTAEAPTEVNYDITASYYIDNGDSGQAADIQAKVTKAVNDYKLWQRSKLGRDIDPSKLYEMMFQAGARKVVVISPSVTILKETELAKAGTVDVKFKGVEDE